MMRPNNRYKCLIEGSENGLGFFVTYEVTGATLDDAVLGLRKQATEEGWTLVAVDEATELGPGGDSDVIAQVAGRSYFGDEG